MGKLKYLVIHSLATPEGKFFDKADVIKWHTSPIQIDRRTGKNTGGRGWIRPGYRDLILLDGTLQNIIKHDNDDFIDRWEVSNGVKGLNGNAAHTAYVGGMDKEGKNPKDTRTEQQLYTMEIEIRHVIIEHPDIQILGHKEAPDAKTACPGFDVSAWLKELEIPKKNIFSETDGKNL